MHHHLPAARESEDNSNIPRRCVKNLSTEERQVVVPAINSEVSEKKMPDQLRSKVDFSLNVGTMCNPTKNQIFSDTTINGFCPIIDSSTHESRMVHVLPLFRPTQSLSPKVDQTFHPFSSMPSEKLEIMNAWSNQALLVSLEIPWNEETISQSLSDMEISFLNKRKHESLEHLELHLSNKRALKDKILKEVIEIELGLWKSTGDGLIENEDVVNFVFSPGSNEGPSKIITRVEKCFKGKFNGFKRISEIKQAVRAKYVKEIQHKFDDETCLLEFGKDPYGKCIFNIPTFNPSPSLTLIEIEVHQCENDANFPFLRMAS
ncbi:hypothetical protein V6N13_123740 [Hibiscus sabdariffa]|uniref:Uncharacterized protein n=1 Tax=Hibiscus sabdariffa TaxID=183260 RepID=A0ABR2QUD4_9ROSI